MNWKAVLAVVLVIAIIGFFFISGLAAQLFPQLSPIASSLNFGGLTGFLVSQRPSNSFPFSLSAGQQYFYGEDFKLTNSSISVAGIYQYITAGDFNVQSSSGNSIEINLYNFNGDFQLTSSGSVMLTGTATYAKFGDIVATPEKNVNLQMEITPSNFTVTSMQLNKINFNLVTGTLQRTSSTNPDVINLLNSNMTVNYFIGGMTEQGGTVTLSGVASSIQGSDFTLD